MRVSASIPRMPTLNVGDPTPRIMVLGLVIQRSDTVAGVARRLEDQFASARFAKTAAYGRLPGLAEKGYVQLVEKGPPDKPTLDRYAATEKGVAYFRKWLRSIELPPIVRDALQCRLEFLERDDLAALLGLVREEEAAYLAACDIAHARVLREQRSRRARGKPVGWRVRLHAIQSKDEATLWSMMSKRLERVGNELEEVLSDIAEGEVV